MGPTWDILQAKLGSVVDLVLGVNAVDTSCSFARLRDNFLAKSLRVLLDVKGELHRLETIIEGMSVLRTSLGCPVEDG